MNIFNGKVIWITGASSGIGEGLVKNFADKNALLVLSSRRMDELKRVQQKYNLNTANSLLLPFDLAETKSIHHTTQQVIEKFGKINYLINNGGISQRANIIDTPIEIDRKIMEVNFFGTIALTKSVLPYMVKQKDGFIVTLSSISGKFGFYKRSTYCASKHALHGFFETLRLEMLDKNIKVLLVCPGKINTNISFNAITDKGTNFGKPEKRLSSGLSADTCAKKIIQGIENNEEEIYIGGKEIMAVWIKRFFPKQFSKIIRKQKDD